MNAKIDYTESPLVTAFIEGFLEGLSRLAREKSRDEIYGLWQDYRSWTNTMLGSKAVASSESVIGSALDRVSESLKDGYIVHQCLSVDLVLASNDTIWGSETSEHYYPRKHYALVEHENNKDWFTELWKLLHLRAPLKVLIGYRSCGFDSWVREEAEDCIREVTEWLGEQAFKAINGTEWPETYLMISGYWPSASEANAQCLVWETYVLSAPEYKLRKRLLDPTPQ